MRNVIKHTLFVLLAFVLLVGVQPIARAETTFSDIGQHWARDTITWAVGQRIVQGYGDSTFRPDRPVAEPEFLVMLLRAYPQISVSDAGGGPWYEKYYNAAQSMNWPVLYDLDNTLFTRGQVAKLVAATQGKRLDVSPAVQYLLDEGLVNGKTSRTVEGFMPWDQLTRAEALQLIKNMKDQQVAVTALAAVTNPAPEKAFAVGGIAIGDSLDTVLSKLGQPTRKDNNSYGFQWYIYNRDYAKYVQIGIKNDRVVGLYSNSSNWRAKSGIQLGSDLATVEKIYGSPLTYILKGNTQYLINTGKHEYDEYLVDGAYTTIFYDTLSKNTVTSIQLIDQQVEEAALGFYGSSNDSLRSGYEREIFDLANVERVRVGKKPFVWDDTAALTSYEHSRDMAVNDYFSHTDLQGGQPWDRGTANGIQCSLYAENIAAGQTSAIMAHQGWMDSAGHRENIMGESLRLGVGVYFGGSQRIYYTQNFYTPY